MKRFFKKRKKLKITLLVFLLLVIIGCLVANHYVKKKGYRNLWDFITTVSHNYTLSRDARFETLDIRIQKDDFKKLERLREKALKRGILIDEGGNFVEAELLHNGKKIKAKVRLKGHMTDHLQNKKWSFRVVTKKGDAFMGMKRFSLQHPGTRNYIYEWIYHQMMKHEGVMDLRYMFLRVKVNGDDWGVYALEEHFAQQLVENNERLKGPIVRFDPELYWSYRINELNRVSILQEYAKFQSSYAEAYDDENTYEDSTLLNRYAKAVLLMEGFRRGQLATSQVFDIQKLARFHAIVDVVGGHHSLDWSDVKYYYNDATGKLEPVAYESFSIRNTVKISGSYRYAAQKPAVITDLHDALFSDRDFYAAYITELRRIATDQWLKTFLKSIDRDLNNNLAILYKEYPYKNYRPDDYFRNIKNIEKILDAPKGVNAFVNHVTADSVYIDLGGIDALPYEVNAIMIDSLKLKAPLTVIVAGKQENGYVNYSTYAWALPKNTAVLPTAKLRVCYNLPGQTAQEKTADIIPVPAWNNQNLSGLVKQPNAINFDFVRIDETAKKIAVLPGKHVLKENLVFPAGYTVHILSATRFDLLNGSCIVSFSPVIINGNDDEPVYIGSSDSSGLGLSLLQTQAPSQLRSVYFTGLAGHAKGLFLYEADASLVSCAFTGGGGGLHIVRSTLDAKKLLFESLSGQAIESDYAQVSFDGLQVMRIRGNGLAAAGSVVKLMNTKFVQVKKKAVYITAASTLTATGLEIEKADLGLESKDASKADVKNMTLSGCRLGLKAGKKGDVYGPASVKITGLKEKDNKTLKEAEKQSVINTGE